MRATVEDLRRSLLNLRVRLRVDVERYPHFIAPAGAVGTVVCVEEDSVSVRMDDQLEGAEEWDNEVMWHDDLGPDGGVRAFLMHDCEPLTPLVADLRRLAEALS